MNEELTVLVVEDNPADLDLIMDVLPETGPRRFKVESATRLAAAIARLAAGGIDVVLLDLGLPDSQGLDTLRAVAGAIPRVPIVVLTGHDDEVTGQGAVRQGAQDYLVKGTMPIRMLGRFLRFAAERHRAEQALADEAVRRRILMEQSRDGIVVLDHNGKVYEANQRYAEMLGYTPEEVRQLHAWDWDTQWTREQLLEMIRSLDASGDHFETRHRRKDGTVRDVEVSSNGAICSGQKLVFCVCRDITERKRTEEALKDSEARYRRLFEAAKDGILILDAETGQVVDVNPFLTEMLGYSYEAFCGKKIWEISLFKDIAASRDAFRTLQEKEYIRYEDLPLETHDGRHIEVEFVSNVYSVDHRKVIQCNIRDITARKRAEEEIRLNEERLRSLASILQYQSDSMTEFLDYALEEAIQLTKSKIGYIYHYHEDCREFVLNTWSKGVMQECAVAKPQSVYQLEKTGLWGEAVRQGRPIIVNDYATPHPLHKGYPEGHAHLRTFMTIPVFDRDSIVAVVGLANKETGYDDSDVLQLTLLMDAVWKVVDQRRSQQRIIHLNRVLRAIREINQLIVRERDPLRIIEQACGLLVKTRGYQSVLIVLTDPAGVPQTFAEAGIGEAFEALAEQLRSGVLPPCCDRARNLTGPYLVTDRADTCAACPIKSRYAACDAICIRLLHGGKLYGFIIASLAPGLGADEEEQSLFSEIAGDLGFALNASELHREAMQAEERHRLAEAQLRQAQKMEALGALSGGIAHDFNNILGIVIGYTEMARLDAPPESPMRAHLLEVMKAGNRAKDLVKQILAFSRQVEQERQPVPVGLLVKEAMKMLRASIPSTIEIRSKVSGEAVVYSDPTMIHQVLMNLCTNASHAMREHGGVLEVSVQDVELTPEVIVPHSGVKPGPHAELIVKDNGHGIDPAIRGRIFDPFFTTKEVNEGTGLGLSVVHGIVTANGGSIEVSSNPGEGTSFRVLLPAMTNHLEPETVEVLHLPVGTEHILFVDDEPSLAMIGKQALEHLGYRVAYQTSSLAAVETFRSQSIQKPFDLLITDMTMPQMTGLELATVLRRMQPDLPVIVCTGFSELIDAEKVRSSGLDGFLMKPVVLDDLARLVRKVLDERVKPDG
jgi:PAS domain S-box-containing protein